MRFLGNLMAAYTVVWVGICCYLVRLTRRTRHMEAEVESLRKVLAPKR